MSPGNRNQAPAEAGADPQKKTEAPRSDRGYICYNSGGVFRQSFSAACNCCCLLKFRIRPHLGIMKKICWRPHVEFRIRKKVTALWTSRFSRFLSVLSDWLTDWHRKFPLIFDHLHLSDFEKWGLFGKLTPWGVRGYKNLGPHPIRIRNILP